ncbi:MAG: hypothetical protein LAN84_04100 [Acidobacteriia bacterium]|nr:hypothetical protein [Terriglobia bacterium]
MPQILALGCAQFGARILELRRSNFHIENKIERDDSGVVHSWYRFAPRISEAQVTRLWTIATAGHVAVEQVRAIIRAAGFTSTKTISPEKYEAIIAEIREAKNQAEPWDQRPRVATDAHGQPITPADAGPLFAGVRP